MLFKRDIPCPPLGGAVTLAYVREAYPAADTAVMLYDTYKISLLLSDGLAAVMGDSVINPGKNNLLFFRPDEIHFGRLLKKGVHAYLDLYLPLSFFSTLWGMEEAPPFLSDRGPGRLNYVTLSPAQQLQTAALAEEAVAALSAPSPTGDMTLSALSLQLILLCHTRYAAQKSAPLKSNTPPYVTMALRYIAAHDTQKISLPAMAAALGCSVTYLTRLFKQYTGKTVYGHVQERRISHAQQLLRQGRSVNEAGFLSGFEDCSHFIRTFKSLTGQTPLQYKRSIGG